MQYHNVYSLPDAVVVEGPDPNPPRQGTTNTFDTFEDARDEAIRDLEHWKEKIEANIERLTAATSIADLQ